jgi:membrane-bound inhibitor of C-type lysozyme
MPARGDGRHHLRRFLIINLLEQPSSARKRLPNHVEIGQPMKVAGLRKADGSRRYDGCTFEFSRLRKQSMNAPSLKVAAGLAVLSWSVVGSASDLTIHLNGSEPISRKTVRYQCDAQGSKMGLPAEVFSVEYVNGAGNSLAIVPVGRHSLIFANIMSGSGARYAALQYIWWDAGGRGVTFSSDSIAGNLTSECHRVE